jgi:hypothetical protein
LITLESWGSSAFTLTGEMLSQNPMPGRTSINSGGQND